VTTISSFLQISKNLSKAQAIEAKKPEIASATKYFQDNIGKIKTADDLIANPRLFRYAMTAFGLGDKIDAKGLMKKVLQQGVTKNNALANTLNNSAIQAFAKTFDFAANGATTTTSASLASTVVARYTENALETDQGQQNPGVQLALYFQQQAPNLKSMYSVLADKNLLTVVQTALGISPSTGSQPVDTQYRLLNSKLKLTDLQDPKKLQNFIARFAANYDAANSTGGSSAVSALFGGSADGSGVISIDSGTLLTAMNSRRSFFA